MIATVMMDVMVTIPSTVGTFYKRVRVQKEKKVARADAIVTIAAIVPARLTGEER